MLHLPQPLAMPLVPPQATAVDSTSITTSAAIRDVVGVLITAPPITAFLSPRWRAQAGNTRMIELLAVETPMKYSAGRVAGE